MKPRLPFDGPFIIVANTGGVVTISAGPLSWGSVGLVARGKRLRDLAATANEPCRFYPGHLTQRMTWDLVDQLRRAGLYVCV